MRGFLGTYFIVLIFHKSEIYTNSNAFLPPSYYSTKSRNIQQRTSYLTTGYVNKELAVTLVPSLMFLVEVSLCLAEFGMQPVWSEKGHDQGQAACWTRVEIAHIRDCSLIGQLIRSCLRQGCVYADFGAYTLQCNKAIFNQYEVNPTCPLCSSGEEDRTHLLLHCEAMKDIRSKQNPQLPSCKGHV